jgi:hypothetical protein
VSWASEEASIRSVRRDFVFAISVRLSDWEDDVVSITVTFTSLMEFEPLLPVVVTAGLVPEPEFVSLHQV